jgi:hypothetical protein
MAPAKRNPKSENDLDPDSELNLPGGVTVEVPVRLTPEQMVEQFEPFRLYWMEHFYDPEERRKSMNSERFVM